VSPTPIRVEQSADLLREANRLRAQGRWAEAAATYRKVIDLGPTSPEAYPADVALGNLELQQGRPLAALGRYQHALTSHPSGALAEEARWGKARALKAAGRTSEERAALIEFRTKHPESPLAPAASARLAEIEN
jgi:tetratricopeptide (TPR) repeat protein